MAQEIAKRWWLPAVVILVLAGAAITWYALMRPATAPLDAATPADAVVVAPATASAGTRLALGMGSDITDDLAVSRVPGTAIAAQLHSAGIALLRFGADAADSYDWESGCSYGNDGQAPPECGNKAGQGSSFDHFLELANAVGARPLIVVNGEIDDPQKAARMVAYYWGHCVYAHDAQGRPSGTCLQPYWEIGYSPATWRHFAIPLPARRASDEATIQPDQYAALVISYAAAMQRATPPHTQLLIVADEWITGATDQSWVARVGAIDTHYASFLYVPGSPQPTRDQIITAIQNNSVSGRPGIDTRLEELRSSLAQFSNSDSIGIIVGQWTIDAYDQLDEPTIYAGYIQAIFAAEIMAHLWQNADPGGINPVIGAIQYPIIGSSQEPFDVVSGAPRSAVAVYHLVDAYFGAYPRSVMVGDSLSRQGVVAAAAARQGVTSVLLVNTDREHPISVRLRGLPDGPCRMVWIEPDQAGTGASPTHETVVRGMQVTLPPWAIAVVQAHSA